MYKWFGYDRDFFFKYLVYDDILMANRGFNIAETVGTYGARLEISSFTKGNE